MPDLGQNRDLETDAEQHLLDHLAYNAFLDAAVKGPFTLAHGTSGIDTGVTLFTPAVGDRIFGITVEFTQVWDVVNEQIGLGIAGTVDADLGFVFPVATVLPVHATWDRGEGLGVPWGTSVVRLKTTAPIVARTVIGGNASGSLNLWVHTFPASVY